MKIVDGSSIAFQGEIGFIRVAEMPANVKKVDHDIVGHSETGHHHRVAGVPLFEVPGDPLTMYLRLEGVEYADVVHHRSHDTHETLRLKPPSSEKASIWMVRTARERSPEGWRRAQD